MSTITAIYENGVFRPTEPVDLPEGCKVRIVPEPERTPEIEAHLDRVYGILSRRYRSGHHDTAERHDEHQPRRPYSWTPLGCWPVRPGHSCHILAAKEFPAMSRLFLRWQSRP